MTRRQGGCERLRLAAAGTQLRARGVRGIAPRSITFGLAVLALVAIGYVVYTRYLAAPSAPVVSGTPTVVARGSVTATVSATGSVVSNRQSKLTMQVAGRLVDIPVRLGDAVKAGAVLARLDTKPLELKLAQAKSTLRMGQLKLDQLKAGSRPEDVAQAEAAVQSAQAKLADVEAGNTPQDIAAQRSAVDSAAASVRQNQAKMDALKAGSTPANISAAENAVVTAQANLDKAHAALDLLKAGTKPEDIRQQELAVEQAKNTLWSRQLSRDATCGRGAGGACDSAKADVASAESAVTQAQVKLQQLKNPPDPKDVEQKQADVDSAKDALRNAQVNLEQTRAGSTPEDIRQQQAALDAAQASYQQAVAKLDALRAGSRPGDVEAAKTTLVQAQQQLALKKAPNTPQDIQLADEQVKTDDLAVQQAQLDLDNATLTAPFDGIVGAIGSNVGEQIGSATTVLTLVDSKAIRVDASVDETDISKIAPNMPAQITFDALPDRRYTGKVIGIAPNAIIQQGVATYTVSVGFDDPNAVVPPGLTANVNIVIAERQNVLLVPNRAIKRQGRNQVVDLLVGNKTESRTIKTGLGNDQVTEVTDGLAEGETVVIPATTTAQPRIGGAGAVGGPPPGVVPGR